jgi:hypothetical protein
MKTNPGGFHDKRLKNLSSKKQLVPLSRFPPVIPPYMDDCWLPEKAAGLPAAVRPPPPTPKGVMSSTSPLPAPKLPLVIIPLGFPPYS